MPASAASAATPHPAPELPELPDIVDRCRKERVFYNVPLGTLSFREGTDPGEPDNNQRLAILGRVMLDAVVTATLMQRVPCLRVGKLETIKASYLAENVSARWFDLYDLQEYVANPATLAGDLSGKARVFRAYVGAVFEEDRLPGLEEWIPALMEYEDYNTDAWFDGSVATSGDWIEKTSHGAPTNLTSAWGSPRPLGSIYVNEDRPQLDVQSSVDGSEPADLRYIEGPPTISPRVSPPSSSIGTDWERVKRVSAERNIIKSELNSSQESLVSMVRGVTETVRPSLPVNSNNRRSPNGNGLASAANTSFSRSPGVSRGSITVRSSDGGVHLRTLNEMFQRNAIDAPKWDIVSQGPPHNPSFVADLTVIGVVFRSNPKSKQQPAKDDAARKFLEYAGLR